MDFIKEMPMDKRIGRELDKPGRAVSLSAGLAPKKEKERRWVEAL